MGYFDNGKGNGWDEEHNRSVNAVHAENTGLLPMSRWKGMSDRQFSDYLALNYCLDDDHFDAILAMSRSAFCKNELKFKESHHVGIFQKLVDYYGLDDDY